MSNTERPSEERLEEIRVRFGYDSSELNLMARELFAEIDAMKRERDVAMMALLATLLQLDACPLGSDTVTDANVACPEVFEPDCPMDYCWRCKVNGAYAMAEDAMAVHE